MALTTWEYYVTSMINNDEKVTIFTHDLVLQHKGIRTIYEEGIRNETIFINNYLRFALTFRAYVKHQGLEEDRNRAINFIRKVRASFDCDGNFHTDSKYKKTQEYYDLLISNYLTISK